MSLVRLLATRAAHGARLAWTTDELAAHRERALGALRAHAYAHSPLYRDFHRGYERAPLSELPVLTKAALMERFDEIVTDRSIRRAEVERYLETASATDRYRGRYRVAATGGTTGRRGIFLASPGEWNTILASYSRAYAWAGLPVGLTHPLRMAIVSSRAPTHQSSIVGATVRNPLVPTVRLDATDSLSTTVAVLNRFRPQALVGYASILGELAAEQRAGRLIVAPRAVFSASEPLTPDIRASASVAWGAEPFNVYAATETACIASECESHHLHLYSDLVIVEVVDADNRPVPDGVIGDKLLVSVLFSRTQPLIRYELTDRVRLAPGSASDLGPFTGFIEAVEGRTEDVLGLRGIAGDMVRIHPNMFHGVLEAVGAPWQVIARPDRIEVLIAGPVDVVKARTTLARALTDAGVADTMVSVRRVGAIARTPLGKAPLIRDLTSTQQRSSPSADVVRAAG